MFSYVNEEKINDFFYFLLQEFLNSQLDYHYHIIYQHIRQVYQMNSGQQISHYIHTSTPPYFHKESSRTTNYQTFKLSYPSTWVWVIWMDSWVTHKTSLYIRLPNHLKLALIAASALEKVHLRHRQLPQIIITIIITIFRLPRLKRLDRILKICWLWSSRTRRIVRLFWVLLVLEQPTMTI